MTSAYYTHAKADHDAVRALSASELQAAIDDAKELLSDATCDFTRDLLAKEEAVLRAEQEQRLRAKDLIAHPPANTTETGRRAVVISKYAWDQSEKFVSLYVDFAGIGELPSESIVSNFTKTSFSVSIDLPDKSHTLGVPNLCYEIIPEKSKVVVKAQRFVLKLKKAEVKEWENLDDVDRKKKEDRQRRIDHGDLQGATTEQLLKDMYDNADEEGKRGLREAMAAGDEKRRKEALAK